MKRIMLTVLVLLLGAYFVKNSMENKAKNLETERLRNAAKVAVAQLVVRTNAVENWEKYLSKGEQFRLEPILTVELERLWLTDRPILFVGAIKDISSIDQENYKVEIERDWFSSFKDMFMTDLQLSLQCSKQKIDLFLTEHADLFKDDDVKNRVVVIADIDKIESKTASWLETEIGESRIGKGKCIDILYLGDAPLYR